MACTVYIIEDHAFMRQVLVDFVGDLPDLEVKGAVETAEEALEELSCDGVDLVLVDIRLPGMDGIEFVGKVMQQQAELQCIMLSAHGERTYVERAMEAGACGYVVKGNPDEISEAIHHVLNGEIYFSEVLQNAGTFGGGS